MLKTMIGKQDIEQVRREKRYYRTFEAKRPRTRNSCPKCRSLNVRKRRDTYDYICYHCGWKGETVTKIEY